MASPSSCAGRVATSANGTCTSSTASPTRAQPWSRAMCRPCPGPRTGCRRSFARTTSASPASTSSSMTPGAPGSVKYTSASRDRGMAGCPSRSGQWRRQRPSKSRRCCTRSWAMSETSTSTMSSSSSSRGPRAGEGTRRPPTPHGASWSRPRPAGQPDQLLCLEASPWSTSDHGSSCSWTRSWSMVWLAAPSGGSITRYREKPCSTSTSPGRAPAVPMSRSCRMRTGYGSTTAGQT